jgi:CheY-like chemotaxis protein
MSNVTLPRVLCVDDEPQVLSGLERNLRRDCPIVTAVGGEAALELLRKDRDFAVIISDMRMPGMDGAAFLSAARLMVPDAVRVLLTGQADLDAVIKAVNGGSISYYLKKPIEKDELLRVIHSAFGLHQESVASRQKLRKLLSASLQLIFDVVAHDAPETWARVERVRSLASQLGAELGFADEYGLTVAASLAALTETHEPATRAARAEALLGSDETLQGAAQTLQELWSKNPQPSAMARVVRAAARIDELEGEPMPPLERERALASAIEPRILEAWRKLPAPPATSLPVAELVPGMVLARSLFSVGGRVMVPRGVKVTLDALARIRREQVEDVVLVRAA